MTFPQNEARLFLGRVEILTNALRRKTNAFRRKRREARACDIQIASLIESSDFFGIFANAVQIMASQSPSFSVA
jgi:hypothetical protein